MITLENLTKVFETAKGSIVATDRISMTVQSGETCILLGPSGCGKTTTMKMVNRLIEPTSGKIFINDKDTSDYDAVALRRTIGYVIQQIGLFPNMTVEENICAVPDLLGWEKDKSRKRAGELLEMLALEPAVFLKRFPKELSGGQQQRIGVARALAADPPVLLMDEPFGAIDPINREVIQDEFLKMQRAIHKTIMFVSHDIDEAVKMGDKIAIFREGKLVQYDTPDRILSHPADGFIADFVGSDRTLKRLRLLTVVDALESDRPSVQPSDDIQTAVRLMRERGHQNIVVVSQANKPVGFLHLNDIAELSGQVGDHQAPLPVLIRMEEDLRSAVSSMFRHDRSWLVVVDSEGKFAGNITQRGITHHLGTTYKEVSST
ncbi:MAG: ABC transporter ATP-binding protein [Hyphomicrobiales bacterium]|nr:ABC transporter ATP-binding protein [Hyphomicrobiales bacterium]